MRILLGLLVVCLSGRIAAAQDWSCPSIRNLDSQQLGLESTSQSQRNSAPREYRLQGSIGSKAVRMYLNLDEPVPRGLFYAPDGDWTPVFLFGRLASGQFDFDAEFKRDKPVGRLQGQFADNVFAGQWTPVGSHHSESVRLTAGPEISCSGKGKWTRFDNPNWSLSFSYPATWKLVVETSGDDRYIRLICPDPQKMIYDEDVFIKTARGQPEELVRCGKQWRYDAGCDADLKDSAFDRTAKETMRHGMKLLDVSGAHEWRAYCRNEGYVGQTEGTDLFLLSPNQWIEISQTSADSDIVGRIAATVRFNNAK